MSSTMSGLHQREVRSELKTEKEKINLLTCKDIFFEARNRNHTKPELNTDLNFSVIFKEFPGGYSLLIEVLWVVPAKLHVYIIPSETFEVACIIFF